MKFPGGGPVGTVSGSASSSSATAVLPVDHKITMNLLTQDPQNKIQPEWLTQTMDADDDDDDDDDGDDDADDDGDDDDDDADDDGDDDDDVI